MILHHRSLILRGEYIFLSILLIFIYVFTQVIPHHYEVARSFDNTIHAVALTPELGLLSDYLVF